MIHPANARGARFKGNASVLHNYRKFLTELQILTQKPEPVPVPVYSLIREVKVQTITPQVLRDMKIIISLPGEKGEGKHKTKRYQWIKPLEINDALVQKVYDRVMEANRKAESERRAKFKDANYVMKLKGMDPNEKVSLPEPEDTRTKRKYTKRKQAVQMAVEQAIVEQEILPVAVPRPTDKPRIKYKGVLFAPKQLAMIGEKKLDKPSTVMVDNIFTFEGVTKLFFEHSDHELRVTFLKEYKVVLTPAMGLVPEKMEERVDVIGSLALKNKTIAMSPRFSDDKSGAFAIETIDL